MPVATRARPAPSRSSVIRSAVSVVVRYESPAPGGGPAVGTERSQQDVVVRRPAERDPDPFVEAADDHALPLEPLSERLGRCATQTKFVAVGGQS